MTDGRENTFASQRMSSGGIIAIVVGAVLTGLVGVGFAIMSQSAKTESTYETREQLDAIRKVPLLEGKLNSLNERFTQSQNEYAALRATLDTLQNTLREYPTRAEMDNAFAATSQINSLTQATNDAKFEAIKQDFKDGRERELRLVNERVIPRLEQDETDLRDIRQMIVNHMNTPPVQHHNNSGGQE